jgi:uncharacterized protein (UPF0276 family)
MGTYEQPRRNMGVGVGLRRPHYEHFITGAPSAVQWIEVNVEDLIAWEHGGGDAALQVLLFARRNVPVALHGTSMSLGSFDTYNKEHVRKVAELALMLEPEIVSDHLCWTGVEGFHTHDLVPVPFTRESVDVMVRHVSEVQDFLKRRILLENLSSYFEYESSEMAESDFISEVARRADCHLLLDINNVFVSCTNHGADPHEFLRNIPHERVFQIHLAGHMQLGPFLYDTHGELMVDQVRELYEWYLAHYGPVSSMIEWDNNIPPWEVLSAELTKVKTVLSKYEGGLRRCA